MSESSWMRVERIDAVTLKQFAATNGLTLVVNERPLPAGDPKRFYARFDRCDTKGDGVLIGEYGDGSTPDEAASDFASRIENKTLVYEAFKECRRDIRVPRVRHVPEGQP